MVVASRVCDDITMVSVEFLSSIRSRFKACRLSKLWDVEHVNGLVGSIFNTIMG